MSNELTDVRCPCGAEFQADSYDAGFIAGSGMCQNCDAALPPKDICTCPSGDGSLRHPCPAHPAVEQACWDERKLSDLGNELHNLSCSIVHENEKLAEQIGGIARELWNWPQARAALAQPSPASDLDPFNLAPHAEAFNEAPDEALRPEQAEAERPVVIARLYRSNDLTMTPFAEVQKPLPMPRSDGTLTVEPLMTVAQHERIVGALRARNEKLEADAGALEWLRSTFKVHKAIVEQAGCGTIEQLAEQRDAANSRLHEVSVACATAEQERDAALARVAELTATRNRYGVDAHYFNKNLQRILRDFESFTPDELARSLIILAKVADEKVVAQAQHSVPEVSGIGRDFAYPRSVVLYLRTEPTDDDLRAIHDGLRSLAAAPGKEGV